MSNVAVCGRVRQSMIKCLKVLFNENANINAKNVSASITSKQRLLCDKMNLLLIKTQIKQNPSTARAKVLERATLTRVEFVILPH